MNDQMQVVFSVGYGSDSIKWFAFRGDALRFRNAMLDRNIAVSDIREKRYPHSVIRANWRKFTEYR